MLRWMIAVTYRDDRRHGGRFIEPRCDWRAPTLGGLGADGRGRCSLAPTRPEIRTYTCAFAAAGASQAPVLHHRAAPARPRAGAPAPPHRPTSRALGGGEEPAVTSRPDTVDNVPGEIGRSDNGARWEGPSSPYGGRIRHLGKRRRGRAGLR